MYVLLNDAGSLLGLCIVGYQVLDFIKVLGHLDALTAIGVLAGLDDPDVFLVCVLLVVGLEPEELGVFQAFFDVEGHRQRVERVLANSLVVVAHVDPESLFVR